MKYLALAILLIAAACVEPIIDTRPAPVAAMTRTALSVLPLPPLPRTIRVWVLPQETAEPSLLPTVTPDGTKASE